MNYENFKQDFAKRFINWQLDEVRNEVKHHYRFLKMLENPRAYQIVTALESLDQTASENLIIALVKSAEHISLSADEQRARAWFFQQVNSPKAIADKFEAYTLAASERPSSTLIKKKNLKILIKEQLRSIGKIIQAESNGLYYKMLIKNWDVSTWVLFGNGSFTFDHHIVARRNGQVIALSPPVGISLGLWLGIDSQLTTWEFLTPETAPRAVSNMSTLCNHFILALPNLLSDIGSP